MEDNKNDIRSNGRLYAELTLVFLSFFIIYASTISDNLSISHDSIQYINEIDNGPTVYHPHHLLYHPTSELWVGAMRIIGIQAKSEYLVALLNAIFGALSISLIFGFIRKRLGYSFAGAFVASALPGVSFGLWFYSVCVEVYIIPLFFMLLAFHFMLSDGRKKYLLVGVCHAMAVLFHQSNVIFAVVILTAMLFDQKKSGAFFKNLFAYLSIALPMALIPYLLVIFVDQGAGSFDDAWAWLTLYSHKVPSWSGLGFSSILKVMTGFGRAFFSTHFLFAIPEADLVVSKTFSNKFFDDESYLVRDMGSGFAWLELVLSVLILILIAFIFIKRLLTIKYAWSKYKKVISLLSVWLFMYALFFTFWNPTNLEFWIPQSVIFWLIFFIIQRGDSNDKTGGMKLNMLILIPLAFLNITSSIIYTVDKSNDYYYAVSKPIAEHTKVGDLLIVGKPWIIKEYLVRYTQTEVVSLTELYDVLPNKEDYSSELKKLIDKARNNNKRIYIIKDILEIDYEGDKFFNKATRDFLNNFNTTQTSFSDILMEIN